MKKLTSAGLFSSLRWGGTELLLQTEVNSSPEPTFTTLLMAGGEVISRIEGPWRVKKESQFRQQRRLNAYHERLLKAMQRLRDERELDVKELGGLFERLVNVAVRLSISPASDTLAALQGARWVSIIDQGGKLIASAPHEKSGIEWREAGKEFLDLARALSVLFGAGNVIDLSLRTKEGVLFVIPHDGMTSLVEVEIGKEEEVLQQLRQMEAEARE